MFVDNYYNLLNGRFFNKQMAFKDTTGATINVVPSPYFDLGFAMHRAQYIDFNNPYTSSSAGNRSGVAFGTGNTPAQRSDYILESQVPNEHLSFTNANSATFSTEEDGSYCVTATYTVRNDTESDIAIREVGYFGEMNKGSTNSPKWYPFLMEHTVLAEPITIPAGQAKVITYKVSGVLSLS